jgi:hypothetical protein
MLKNKAFASTCNSVGQSLGVVVASTLYFKLEGAGIVTFPSFLRMCGLSFIVITVMVSASVPRSSLETKSQICWQVGIFKSEETEEYSETNNVRAGTAGDVSWSSAAVTIIYNTYKPQKEVKDLCLFVQSCRPCTSRCLRFSTSSEFGRSQLVKSIKVAHKTNFELRLAISATSCALYVETCFRRGVGNTRCWNLPPCFFCR